MTSPFHYTRLCSWGWVSAARIKITQLIFYLRLSISFLSKTDHGCQPIQQIIIVTTRRNRVGGFGNRGHSQRHRPDRAHFVFISSICRLDSDSGDEEWSERAEPSGLHFSEKHSFRMAACADGNEIRERRETKYIGFSNIRCGWWRGNDTIWWEITRMKESAAWVELQYRKSLVSPVELITVDYQCTCTVP